MSDKSSEDKFLVAVSSLRDAISKRDRSAAKLAMVETTRLWPECWASLKEVRETKSSPLQAAAAVLTAEKEVTQSKSNLLPGTK